MVPVSVATWMWPSAVLTPKVGVPASCPVTLPMMRAWSLRKPKCAVLPVTSAASVPIRCLPVTPVFSRVVVFCALMSRLLAVRSTLAVSVIAPFLASSVMVLVPPAMTSWVSTRSPVVDPASLEADRRIRPLFVVTPLIAAPAMSFAVPTARASMSE